MFTAYWTYELPFGRGRRLGGDNAIVNHVIGGWTFSGILRMQSGRIFQLVSGRRTFNTSDSGIVLRGISVSELQSRIISRPTGTDVLFFPPELIGSDGRSNRSVLDVPTTPGQFGSFVYLRGPRLIVPDLAIAKNFVTRGRTRLEFRADFFNAFNHQTWLVGGQFWSGDPTTVSIDSTSFGRTTQSATGPRNIQFRVSLVF